MPNTTTNTSIALFKESFVHHTPASHHMLQRLTGPGRLLLGVLAALSVALALPVTPARAAEDPCPNAALRALNNSSGLPGCRAYEMVTSPYKEGFVAQQQTFGDNGAYAYHSLGNFVDNPFGVNSGNQYVATRSAAGWTTVSHNPPGDQWVFHAGEGAQDGLSADLLSSVWMMRPYARPSDPDGVYVRRPDGEFSFIGIAPPSPRPFALLRTPDLAHLVVGATADSSPQPDNLYEFTDSDHAPRPVEVDNTGAPLPQTDVACPLSMSDDGRVISFGIGFPTCNVRLWARVGAATTIDLAASECTRTAVDPGGVCNGPAAVNFAGSALNGSRALFTTTQQLVNGDTDATNDLYSCDIPSGTVAHTGLVNGCPHLREVSGAASGADVQDVVRVADDGSRVYFTAKGVLADNLGANDQGAVAGANNVYVWQQDAEHPAGRTTFMARLQSSDIGGNGNVETTADGRYLLVNTTTPLVTSGASADTDSSVDVYRYDAETETWLRISTDSSGAGGNAALEATSRGSTKSNYRARVSMTADGRTVVFQTEEALAPADANSAADVYVWHGGQVSLISADGGGEPRITSSGTDIFFTTGDHLTAADGDTNADVYDARVGGGFDLREPAPCEGDGCLGARSTPPGVGTGAGGSGGPGNVQEPAPTFMLRPLSAAQRRTLTETGRVTLTVTASKPGTVRARAEATVKDGGKLSSVALARDVLALAGSVQLTLRLSMKARARLAAKRRLALTVVVSHSKFALTRSITLTLKAKAKKAAKRSSVGRASVGKGGRS
jgi:hypothetical protein